jgi:hypothetical protein
MQANEPLPLTMAYVTTAVCCAAAALYAALALEPAPLVGLTIAFGPLVAVLLWLHEDARRTKAVTVQDWGFFLWVAWPALLPWYAVKTRGRRGWLLTLGLAALVVAPFFMTAFVTVFWGHLGEFRHEVH